MDCLPPDATLAERLAGPSSLAAGLATLRYHQDLGTLAPEVHLAVSLVTEALAVAARREAAARAGRDQERASRLRALAARWEGTPHLTRDDTPNEGPRGEDEGATERALAEAAENVAALVGQLVEARRLADEAQADAAKWRECQTPNGNEAAQRELAQFRGLLEKNAALRAELARGEARREEGLGMLICAERDPDDIGARWAYDRALEDAARWIELGWPRGEPLGETMWQLAATLRTMRKHPEIADPMTYLEPFAEAVARDAKYAALLTAEAVREAAEWRARLGAAGEPSTEGRPDGQRRV
jgi:hypothetical protein